MQTKDCGLDIRINSLNGLRFVQLRIHSIVRCIPNMRQTNTDAASENMDRKSYLKFTETLRYMFYVTKFFGLIPYSLSSYRRQRIFESSIWGNLQSISFLIFYLVSYHFAVAQIYFTGQTFDSGKKINIFSNIDKKTSIFETIQNTHPLSLSL